MSGNESSPGTYTYVCVFSFRTVSQGHPNWKVTKEKGVINGVRHRDDSPYLYKMRK